MLQPGRRSAARGLRRHAWGLAALGFMVVPLLFKHLGSPAEAGAMAAKLFSAQTWVSVACTMLLLLLLSRKDAGPTESNTNVRKITAWAVACCAPVMGKFCAHAGVIKVVLAIAAKAASATLD